MARLATSAWSPCWEWGGLVFTQVIFTPEPIALVRRAERQALRGLAGAPPNRPALARSDHAPSEPDLSWLRELRGQLADVGGPVPLAGGRRDGRLWRHRVRCSCRSRERRSPELLGSSCITFLRTAALTEDRNDRRRLAPHVEDLAETVADLASDPADQATRQRAVRRAIQVAHNVSELTQPVLAPETTAAMTFLLVVFDLLVCAGVNPRLPAAMRGDLRRYWSSDYRRGLPLWPRRRRESTTVRARAATLRASLRQVALQGMIPTAWAMVSRSHRHRLICQGAKSTVTQYGADLILSAVAASDRLGIVEPDSTACSAMPGPAPVIDRRCATTAAPRPRPTACPAASRSACRLRPGVRRLILVVGLEQEASTIRVRPAEGSITYGTRASPSWSVAQVDTGVRGVVRSKSVAGDALQPGELGLANRNRYSMSTVRLE